MWASAQSEQLWWKNPWIKVLENPIWLFALLENYGAFVLDSQWLPCSECNPRFNGYKAQICVSMDRSGRHETAPWLFSFQSFMSQTSFTLPEDKFNLLGSDTDIPTPEYKTHRNNAEISQKQELNSTKETETAEIYKNPCFLRRSLFPATIAKRKRISSLAKPTTFFIRCAKLKMFLKHNRKASTAEIHTLLASLETFIWRASRAGGAG